MGRKGIAGVALAVLTGAAMAQTMFRWLDRDGTVHYSDQPPPPEIKKVDERRIKTPSFIETSGASYSLRRAQQGFPITLYSTPDCDNECKTAREYLNRRGVPFTEVAVTSPEQEAAFKEQFGGDEIVVPSMALGTHKEKGFEEVVWRRLLDDVGYPRTAVPGSVATRSIPLPAPSHPAEPGTTPTPAAPGPTQ